MSVRDTTKPLNAYAQDLAARHYEFALSQVRWHSMKLSRYLTKDEIESECLNALVTVAARWESYCAENGYDIVNEEFFRVYLKRRIKGAFADLGRANDYMSRSKRHEMGKALELGVEISPVDMRVAILMEDEIWKLIASDEATIESEVAVAGLREVVMQVWESMPLKQKIALAAAEQKFIGFTVYPPERSKTGEQALGAALLREAVARHLDAGAPKAEVKWKPDTRDFVLSDTFQDFLDGRKESLEVFLSKFAEELSSDYSLLSRIILKTHVAPRTWGPVVSV